VSEFRKGQLALSSAPHFCVRCQLGRWKYTGPAPAAGHGMFRCCSDRCILLALKPQILPLSAVRPAITAQDLAAIPRGPVDAEPFHAVPWGGGADVLYQALAGVELGRYDRHILDWLASYEESTAAVLCSWILRARAAAVPEAVFYETDIKHTGRLFCGRCDRWITGARPEETLRDVVGRVAAHVCEADL
jgi:hypothetical protein